jgi:hypothetical protein
MATTTRLVVVISSGITSMTHRSIVSAVQHGGEHCNTNSSS